MNASTTRLHTRRCSLIVFDLDGTLIDSLEDLADAMNAVLSNAGHPTHPIHAYRHFVGDGIENLVRRAMPAARREDHDHAALLLAGMRDEYRLRGMHKTRPYPGIPAMLDALRDAGIACAILTNKPQAAAEQIVSALFSSFPFAALVGARPNMPVKPDPAGLDLLLAEIGCGPADAIYVGDTDTDMKTGRSRSLFTLGVAWGFRPVEELQSNGADHIVNDPADIVECALQRNNAIPKETS